MYKSKNIEKEIKEAAIKTNEIAKEVDTNEVNTEAETIKDIKVKVFNKEYNISELIEITDKENKSYEEIEISKKFKLLMKNYYEGILYAALTSCCGKRYTINDLKTKLRQQDTYRIIDIRCSRNNIRFNKDTVDTVIKIAEKYNLDK